MRTLAVLLLAFYFIYISHLTSSFSDEGQFRSSLPAEQYDIKELQKSLKTKLSDSPAFREEYLSFLRQIRPVAARFYRANNNPMYYSPDTEILPSFLLERVVDDCCASIDALERSGVSPELSGLLLPRMLDFLRDSVNIIQ